MICIFTPLDIISKGDIIVSQDIATDQNEVIMMIYITGDTHAEYDNFLNRLYHYPIGAGDTVIVTGDFCFVRDEMPYSYYLKQLSKEPFTITFIDGNHDDHALINTYPVVDLFGGKAHRITENIYHLMRGQLFTIEGKTFFTFGGAYSHDKDMRTEGYDWWPEELPGNSDYDTAAGTLNACNNKVDHMITHTLPQSIIHYIGRVPEPQEIQLDSYFEWLYHNCEFKMWYGGHFHINRLVRGNVHILYDEVVRISENGEAAE